VGATGCRTSSNIQIMPPPRCLSAERLFSDGNYIYYQARDKANPQGMLLQVPALAVHPEKSFQMLKVDFLLA
jgi:hypothetical protein